LAMQLRQKSKKSLDLLFLRLYNLLAAPRFNTNFINCHV
jgi:hypothetical protein